MRSKLAWIAAGMGIFVLCGVLSYWLLLFSLLGLTYFLFRFLPGSKGKKKGGKKDREGDRLGLFFVAGTSILLFVLFFTGVLRPTKHIGSCLTGPTMRGVSLIHNQKAALLPQQPQNSKQIDFINDVLRVRDRARSTLSTDLVLNQLTSFLEKQRSVKDVADVVELRSKLLELRSFLRSHSETGLDDPDARRANEKLLEGELDKLIDRAGKTTNPTEEQRLQADLDRIVTRSPYFDLQLRLSDLEDLQHHLANIDVKSEVTPRIYFKDDQLVLEESIALATTRGELMQVDAEPLAHEAALDGMAYELVLHQADGDFKFDDLEQVDFSPKSTTATLLSRRIVKVDAASSCSAGYLSGIQHLNLRWPPLREMHLAVRSKTADFGVIRSSIELDRSSKLESIAIPLWSYFTAKEDLDVSRKQGVDTLKHPKDALTESALSGPDPFWIEVFRDTDLLRNPVVQHFRDDLIAENAISGFLVMVLTFLLSTRVFKS
jgi:hypothetical protein